MQRKEATEAKGQWRKDDVSKIYRSGQSQTTAEENMHDDERIWPKIRYVSPSGHSEWVMNALCPVATRHVRFEIVRLRNKHPSGRSRTEAGPLNTGEADVDLVGNYCVRKRLEVDEILRNGTAIRRVGNDRAVE
ncbi:unnamed protein product [Caenorhabditis auriculariae]|uniref:Uncharacterized protein n=1 Tax=Caenorhabditis auriculariae TaxID=2777116 RepID=A0A8S1H2W5_9PELO|nr:unnamed protein product [Caenorhabditis auriculariae]